MMFDTVSLKRFVGAILFLGAGFVCSGATVYFNDANRGASSTLDIDGVTASSITTAYTNGVGYSPVTTGVATAAGVGLGCSGPGTSDSFDLKFHYLAGDSTSDWSITEVASLALDDPSLMITAVTIAPRVTATVGSLDPVSVQLPFTTSVSPASGGGPGNHEITSSDPATFTVSFYNGPSLPFFITPDVSLSAVLSGMGDSFPAGQYRQDNISEDVTLDYGFSIVSISYAAVPEPGTGTLMGLGLGFIFCRGSKLFHRK